MIEPGAGSAEIAAQVERAIGDGSLEPGAQLPTIRELAAAVGVSPATVSAAYRTLGRRGLVVANRRRGTVVSAQPPLRLRGARSLPAGVRDLARGNPDPAFLPPLGPALARLDRHPVLYGEPVHQADLVRVARAAFAGRRSHRRDRRHERRLDGIERALDAQLRPGTPSLSRIRAGRASATSCSRSAYAPSRFRSMRAGSCRTRSAERLNAERER